MQDNFEFSAYLMYQVFPVIKEINTMEANQLSIWVDNDSVPNVSIGRAIGPKWGAPMIRISLDYEAFARKLASNRGETSPDAMFDALVISVFQQILHKAHLLDVDASKFIECFKKDKEEVESLKRSLLALLPTNNRYGAH